MRRIRNFLVSLPIFRPFELITDMLLDVGLNGRGGDQWSQVAYLHNLLGFDLNNTEIAGDLSNVDAPFWVNL
jgi:hypothetical protein